MEKTERVKIGSLPATLVITGNPAGEVKVFRNGLFLDPVGSNAADDYTLTGKTIVPRVGYIEVGDTWKWSYFELVQVPIPPPTTTTVKVP